MSPMSKRQKEGDEGALRRRPYHSPCLKSIGTLAELTQGFSGSIPDERGGQTKRNPYQG